MASIENTKLDAGYVNGKWAGTQAGPGTVIDIPESKGAYYTHMGWSCITNRSTIQYKLREAAGEHYDGEGFARIDGRYVVAVTPKFGRIGDNLTITFAEGETMYAVIGDFKGPDAQSEWGHTERGRLNVIEFVVDKESHEWCGYGGTKTPQKVLTWLTANPPVTIKNTGNYWNVRGLKQPA